MQTYHALAKILLCTGILRARPLWRTFAVVCLALTLTAWMHHPLYADPSAEIVVNSAEDSNDPCTPTKCTLRAAITLANSTPDPDTIMLGSISPVLTLPGIDEDDNASGDLDITAPLTIEGAGTASSVVSGNGLDRVFHLLNPGPAPFEVRFSGFTIRNGAIAGGALNSDGAAIYVGSSVNLRLDTMIVRNNSTTNGDGGGLYAQGSTIITVRSSTFVSNTAGVRGGAIAANDTLIVENSTFSGNTAVSGGGIHSNDNTQLRNATLTLNTGGGVVVAPSTSFLTQNSIISANDDDCQGPVDSNGFNLVGSSCALASSTSSDLVNDDPKLGPLTRYNTNWLAHMPRTGSPARDAGSDDTPGTTTNACLAQDIRRMARPIDGNGDGVARCDIGAIEFKPFTTFLPLVDR
jgi:CSLREA domain-containing protein